MTRPKKIVVLGHDASMSGAPVLLLHLLQLLHAEPAMKVSLVALQRPGPLKEHFSRHFRVIVLKPAGYATSGNLLKRMVEIVRNRIRLLQLCRQVASADLIFSNTIVNGKLLNTLAWLKKPVISYVHELEHVLAYYAQSGETVASLQRSKLIAYPSSRVSEVLQQLYGVASSRLHRLSYYLPIDEKQLTNATGREQFVQAFRQRYGLQQAGMLIVGMGKMGWRKGTDLFLQICELVTRENDDIRFCWIGDGASASEDADIQKKVLEKELTGKIVFTGVLSHNYLNLAAFDLFLLSSREDPYPLVVLEAALMGVPTICFENSGGISEFVGDDAGWVIPGPEFDVRKAADRILQLYLDRAVVNSKGVNARERCMQWHVNGKRIMDQFKELLNEVNA